MQIILKKKSYNGTNRTFGIDEGSVYIENYNETLDSATIRISHLTEQLNIEPYDKVILHDENGRLDDKYMCVDTYTETMESLDPLLYTYEISLFSETKELEGTLCPNLSVTQLTNGTHRKIWYYLKQYNDLYGEKIRVNVPFVKQKKYDSGYIVKASVVGTAVTVSVDLDFVLASNMRVANVTYKETFGMSNVDISSCSLDYQSDKTVFTFTYTLVARIKVIIKYEETIAGFTFTNKYTFSPRVQNKFNSIECPEMQWNAPTLREVLNDLMMVADCIPIVRNNVIDYIDLTEKKSDITNVQNHINYIQRSQSSEDYVSELKMDMQNVMQTKVNKINNSVRMVEYITFRTDGNILTTDNMYLKTSKPINKLLELQIYRPINISGPNNNGEVRMFVSSLTDLGLVHEKQEYDCLDIPSYAYSPYTHDIDELRKYQSWSLYYERGTNIIGGFTNLVKKTPINMFGQTTVFYLILELLAVKQYFYSVDPILILNPTLTLDDNTGNAYFTTAFRIEYETLDDAVFTASKDLPPTHNRVVVDNQTNSYVDAYNQGFMEYQKVNRLGNQQLFINARYLDDFSNIIKIGDYYNDSIVFQTQYQIYKDHIEVNAYATKDYVLRDYFTGVKAHIRSWRLASGSDVLTRHDLDKYYLELSFRRKEESIDLDYSVAYETLNSINVSGYNSYIKYCFVRFDVGEEDYRPSEEYTYIATDLSARIIGNSLVFNFGTEDNYQIGKRVSSEVQGNGVIGSEQFIPFSHGGGTNWSNFRLKAQDWSNQYGGIKLEPVKYVDDNGEIKNIEYIFAYEMKDKMPRVRDIDVHELTEVQQREFLMYLCKVPVIEDDDFKNYAVVKNTYPIYKDNRETLRLSSQYELCTDTHDIVFTKKFLEIHQWIRTIGLTLANFNVRYGSASNFNYKNLTLDNTQTLSDATITVTKIGNKIATLEINTDISATDNVFYICYNDEILLAIKGQKKIYLNVLKKREYSIYDTNGDIVGSI